MVKHLSTYGSSSGLNIVSLQPSSLLSLSSIRHCALPPITFTLPWTCVSPRRLNTSSQPPPLRWPWTLMRHQCSNAHKKPSHTQPRHGVCAETLRLGARLDDGGWSASLDDIVPADLFHSALCLADVNLMFGRRSLSKTPAAWAMPSALM